MGENFKRISKTLKLLLAITVSISVFCGIGTIARANEQDGVEIENDRNVSATYNVTAPSFSLPTLSGGTVTQSTYGSKTQLFVFYRGNGQCGNSNRAIESIASSYWVSNSNIKVIAIEADGASASTVMSFKEQEAPSNDSIVWAYDGENTMWNYVRQARGYGGSITYAVCAIVQNGKIVELWTSEYNADNCEEALRKYVDLGRNPSLGNVKVSGTYCGSTARSMFDSVNSFRTQSNVWQWNSDNSTKTYFNTSGATTLSPLQYDYDLEKAAMERAKELAVMYSHTRPNGKSNATITRRSNTTYGENIAYGYTSAADVLEAWIEEDEDYSGQGHRRNLLYSGYTTIGLGCFYANGTYYWVQEFGNVNSGPNATNANDNKVVEEVEYSSNYVNLSNRYTRLIFYQNDGTSSSVYYRYQLGAPFGSLYNAVRRGYKLDGWFKAPNGGIKISESTVADTIGDVNVYAHWTPKEKAVVTKAPVAKTLLYDGNYQELVTAGETTGGTLVYATSRNATNTPADNYFSTEIPTALNRGTYYVWYKALEDDNYAESDLGCVTVSIEERANRHLVWEVINGKSYWYENNVRQGTTSDTKCFSYDGTLRGREIYDPGSDGWYWLDVNADGAKAVGKEVFMPYIYQNEAEWRYNDDELNRNAAASGAYAEGNIEHAELADQIIRAIQNGTGKWVRYDNEGKMLKGWVIIEGELADLYPNQAGNIYYYDRKTGLMAKGETVIDGVIYYFDEITGVLR